MDQDGFDIALALVTILFLLSGLYRGAFDIQFVHVNRRAHPVAYWLCVLLLALVGYEAARRAWFGCIEC